MTSKDDWSIGGSGRAERSGNGLTEWNELGVDVTRSGGGHWRNGGRSSFSLWLEEGLSVDEEYLSRSLSLSFERLNRWKRAFMVERGVIRRERCTCVRAH